VVAAATQSAPPVRAGIVNESVLAMEGVWLNPGTELTMVTIENPQRVQHAVVARRIAASETMSNHIVAGPYYELSRAAGEDPQPGVAVALLGRPEVQRTGTAVILRFSPALTVRIRSCASVEGLHLTLWNGEPLKSTRLWHGYYYVGYDMVPNCEPGDYDK
jgi:hypothetical protein